MYHLITGGSSGLGLEIAKMLMRMDEHVIILGRNKQKLDQALEQLKEISKKGDALAYSIDISDETEVDGFIETLETSGKTVRYLYNVAGTTYYGPVEEVDRGTIDEVLSSNMIGLMLLTSKLLKTLLKSPYEEKRIISVLSTAALVGKKHESIYNAAKWGARGYLEALRDELKDRPVSVINIFPGGMKTPFWEGTQSGYDIDSFMDPSDVARNIVKIALDTKVYVSDITINRPKG